MLVGGGCIGIGGSQTPVPQSASPHDAVIKRYCIGCHNSKIKQSEFSLENLQIHNAGRNPEAWEKVVRKLRGRYMPPAGLPRPDETTYQAIVATLEQSLDSAALAKPNPGRTDTFR